MVQDTPADRSLGERGGSAAELTSCPHIAHSSAASGRRSPHSGQRTASSIGVLRLNSRMELAPSRRPGAMERGPPPFPGPWGDTPKCERPRPHGAYGPLAASPVEDAAAATSSAVGSAAPESSAPTSVAETATVAVPTRGSSSRRLGLPKRVGGGWRCHRNVRASGGDKFSSTIAPRSPRHSATTPAVGPDATAPVEGLRRSRGEHLPPRTLGGGRRHTQPGQQPRPYRR